MLCARRDIKVGATPKQPFCQEVRASSNADVFAAALSSFSLAYTLDAEYDVSTVTIKRNHEVTLLPQHYENPLFLKEFWEQFL